MRLERSTWVQAEEYLKKRDIVLLAVGSIECHGRHNALGTDTLIPNRLLELIEEKSDVMILPTLPYGNADWHTGFPGTITIGPDLLYQTVKTICTQMYRWGIRKFVILNGHGGNTASLERVAGDLDQMGGIAAILNWWTMVWDMNPAWKGGHGGGEETAGLLAIDENLVDKTEIGDAGLKHLSKDLVSTGFRSVSYKGVSILIPRTSRKVVENGWFGIDHPKEATVQWGKEMLQTAADYIVDFLGEFENLTL